MQTQPIRILSNTIQSKCDMSTSTPPSKIYIFLNNENNDAKQSPNKTHTMSDVSQVLTGIGGTIR